MTGSTGTYAYILGPNCALVNIIVEFEVNPDPMVCYDLCNYFEILLIIYVCVTYVLFNVSVIATWG